jgi:hypothetical protein
LNCTLTSGKPHYSYKKPFAEWVEGYKTANWQALVDEFRTFMLDGDLYHLIRNMELLGIRKPSKAS